MSRRYLDPDRDYAGEMASIACHWRLQGLAGHPAPRDGLYSDADAQKEAIAAHAKGVRERQAAE